MDGNDVDAVYEIASTTIERARSGGGPSLVEAKTYRHKGHSRADPGKYRPDEEVAEWLQRDPIPLMRSRLESEGVPTTTLDAIDGAASDEIEQATAETRAAPPPPPETLKTDVWADGGFAWRN